MGRGHQGRGERQGQKRRSVERARSPVDDRRPSAAESLADWSQGSRGRLVVVLGEEGRLANLWNEAGLSVEGRVSAVQRFSSVEEVRDLFEAAGVEPRLPAAHLRYRGFLRDNKIPFEEGEAGFQRVEKAWRALQALD